jgi:CubicO group peptidase (beta-lactamase class C family)
MMRMRFAPIAFGLVAALALACQPAVAVAETPAPCGAPGPGAADGWKTVSPAEVGLDSKRLCALIDWLNGLDEGNVHGIAVVRRGALLFEHYRKGADERWGFPIGEIAYGPRVKHDMRSISKSVTSLLVGIALDRKLIADIDRPVFDFFPEYAELRTPEKDRILIRHLLTMSAGFEWDEVTIPYTNPANSEIRMIRSPDPYRYVLALPMDAEPGETFNYSGGATTLLGRIVEKVTDKPLEQFAKDALFDPLGITDFDWVKMPSGGTAAASGLRLRPRDLAKLGQLMLAHGQWDGRQIVSPTWIEASSTPHIEGTNFLFYGYQWWLGRSLIDGREVGWTAGLGLGGQRLLVVPALDLVVVITAGYYTSPAQRWVPWWIFRRHIVPAVRRGD